MLDINAFRVGDAPALCRAFPALRAEPCVSATDSGLAASSDGGLGPGTACGTRRISTRRARHAWLNRPRRPWPGACACGPVRTARRALRIFLSRDSSPPAASVPRASKQATAGARSVVHVPRRDRARPSAARPALRSASSIAALPLLALRRQGRRPREDPRVAAPALRGRGDRGPRD